MPLVRRTRATLRRAEFGFFGVVVYTRVHTPRRWGAPLRAGVLVLSVFDSRPLRTNCWMVGKPDLCKARSGQPDGAKMRPRPPRPTDNGRDPEGLRQTAAVASYPEREP